MNTSGWAIFGGYQSRMAVGFTVWIGISWQTAISSTLITIRFVTIYEVESFAQPTVDSMHKCGSPRRFANLILIALPSA
jgi:hypothetical protein